MADDKDSPLVELSVSGTSFTILRSTLSETNWILAKAFDNEVPWGVYHNGKYFIDGDPISFRWILHYVRHNSLPEAILQSQKELSAIRTLADFLCYSDLVEFIDRDKSCSRVEELERGIDGLKTQLQTAKKENASKQHDSNELQRFTEVFSVLNNMTGQTYKCPDGNCDQWIIVLSSMNQKIALDAAELKCPTHGGEFRRGSPLSSWSRFPLIRQLEEFWQPEASRKRKLLWFQRLHD